MLNKIENTRNHNRRHLYAGAYLSVMLLLLFALLHFGWTKGWAAVQVAGYPPAFADMRTVQAALASEKAGLDPMVANPTDPYQRPMNYPGIWLLIAKWLALDDESNFIAVVGMYCALYVAATASLIWKFPSNWLLLVATSNAALMVLERGNNDIVIFLLAFVASALVSPPLIMFVIVAATGLKIYPLALVIGLRDRPGWFFICITLLLALLIVQAADIGKLIAGTPVSTMTSFGTKSIEGMFAFNFPLKWLGRQVNWWEILLILVLTAVYLARRFRALIQTACLDMEKFDARLFVSGASIYAFTFAVGSNFDYRLIFLILCVPWLCRNSSSLPAQATIICILLAMYADLLQRLGPVGWLVAVAAKCELFVVFTSILVHVVISSALFRGRLASTSATCRRAKRGSIQ